MSHPSSPSSIPISPAAAVLLAAVGLVPAGCAGPGEAPLVDREYAVASLVRPRPDYAAPRLGITAGTGAPDQEGAGDRGRESGVDRERELVRLVAPAVYVSPRKGNRIEAEKGVLRVTAPEEVQAEVARLLDRLERAAGRAVSIETRVIALDAVALGRLGPDARRSLGILAFLRSPSALTARERTDLIAAVDREGARMNSPRVTAFDGQRSHTRIISQEAIITSVEGAGAAAKPVIGVLNTGVTLEVRPAIDDDGKSLALEYAFQAVDVERPVPSKVVEGIAVAAPVERRTAFGTAIDIPAGACIPAGAALPSAGPAIVLLVRAEILESPPPGPGEPEKGAAWSPRS